MVSLSVVRVKYPVFVVYSNTESKKSLQALYCSLWLEDRNVYLEQRKRTSCFLLWSSAHVCTENAPTFIELPPMSTSWPNLPISSVASSLFVWSLWRKSVNSVLYVFKTQSTKTMNAPCTYASAKSDPCETRESTNLIHCRTSLSEIIYQRVRKRSEETNELKKHSFAIRCLFMCCVRFEDLDEVSVAVDRRNQIFHWTCSSAKERVHTFRIRCLIFIVANEDEFFIHCCKWRRILYSLLQRRRILYSLFASKLLIYKSS